jgi:hypothetical protein
LQHLIIELGVPLYPQVRGWLENLSVRVWFAYHAGHHFPISTDSYDDLVAMHFSQAPPKEKLMEHPCPLYT